MVELNEKALEAAHHAYQTHEQMGDLKARRLSDSCLTAVITAYLAALPEEVVFCPNCGWNSAMDAGPATPDPDDGLIGKLLEAADDWRRLSDPENEELMLAAATALQSKEAELQHLRANAANPDAGLEKVAWMLDYPGTRTRRFTENETDAHVSCKQSGAMSTPLVRLSDAKSALQSKDEQIERLTRERDEWRDHVHKQNANVAHNLARAETLEQQVQKLTAALNWALGCNGDFRHRDKGEGAFWWRKELSDRAGLTYDREYGSYRSALETQEGGK